MYSVYNYTVATHHLRGGVIPEDGISSQPSSLVETKAWLKTVSCFLLLYGGRIRYDGVEMSNEEAVVAYFDTLLRHLNEENEKITKTFQDSW
jgi:hypothetical protein